MALPNNKALTCTNCGGQLEYNYSHDISKCLYCGTEFKKEYPEEESYDNKFNAEPTFVETSVDMPEENKVIYNAVFNNRPKPDMVKFKKAFLWGLGAWASWLIVSPMIAGIMMASSGKLVAPNNLFSSLPFGLSWCLRGVIFCLVWPSLRANGYFQRK